MKRINKWTLQFDRGDEPIIELGWYSGRWKGDDMYTETNSSYVLEPEKKDPSCNFWTRRDPWNLVGGRIDKPCWIGAPEAVLDAALTPKSNEWGEVFP